MLQFIEIGDYFQGACVVFETKFLIDKNYQLLRMFMEISTCLRVTMEKRSVSPLKNDARFS